MNECIQLTKIHDYAEKKYNEANCTYDGGSYMHHINMVIESVQKYSGVFKKPKDIIVTMGSASCHDLIEDAKETFNNIVIATGSKDIGKITLAVTDVHAENRLMRHLLTMHKTVGDYRAIILKMCDIRANAMYSKSTGSSMYVKYCNEYLYRRPIFKQALGWYKDELNQKVLNEFWNELDEIHRFNK